MTTPEAPKDMIQTDLNPRHERAGKLAATIGIVAFLGGIAAASLLIYKVHGGASLDEIYDKAFTGPGKCLDGTPYDLKDGAVMNVNKNAKSGQDILSILPQAANSYTPSVLFFTEGEVSGHTKLAASDHQTQAFLIAAHCPDQPSGL